MQKTQQFIKGVKDVRVTRLKQQIFFSTYEHSMMTVGTMGSPYKAIYLILWEIETTISDKNVPYLAQFRRYRQLSQSWPWVSVAAWSGTDSIFTIWRAMTKHELTKTNVTECQSGVTKRVSSFKIIITYDWCNWTSLLIPPLMSIRIVFAIVLQLVINESFIQYIRSFMCVYCSRSIANSLAMTRDLLCKSVLGCVKIVPVEIELKITC